MDQDEREFHFGKRPDRTYYSRRIAQGAGPPVRIVSTVLEGSRGLSFAKVNGELVLRATPGGRVEIKATVVETPREVRVLTIQRYNPKSGPNERIHFSFVGGEIDALLEFAAGVKTVNFENDLKGKLTRDAVRSVVLSAVQAKQVFQGNEELFLALAEREDIRRDLVAVGYRRAQLRRFELLLGDKDAFAAEQARLGKSPEAVWQSFFEENTWIFGYGLSYQFLSSLEGKRLEQTVRGADIGGAGKRVDALMKTRGLINSLCFVEIKRHDTPLLAGESPYRKGAWAPSTEVVGGVAQVQATVGDALDRLQRAIRVTDDIGDPTDEILFNVRPRAFLVVGDLAELRAEHGINQAKFRSFETYRRETRSPEILTFDELLERARFIVDHPVKPLADATE